MGQDLRIGYAKTAAGSRVAFGVQGHGPVVITMPAGASVSDFSNGPWTKHSSHLAETHTVVHYDHLGCGLSDRDHYDYSLDGLEGELEAVRQELGAGTIRLAGITGTVPTAIRYTARNSERVAALTLTGGYARGRDFVGTERYRSYRRALEGDWEIASETFARVLMGLSGTEALHMANLVRNATSQRAYLAYLDAITMHDATRFLGRVQARTLIIHNENSLFLPVALSEELTRGIPGSRLVTVGLHYYPHASPGIHAAAEFLREMDCLDSGRLEVSRVDSSQLGPQPGHLSIREIQILRLLASGHSNDAMADRLTVSTRTVERHVQNIYGKLGVHNRVEAANWAREHGVL